MSFNFYTLPLSTPLPAAAFPEILKRFRFGIERKFNSLTEDITNDLAKLSLNPGNENQAYDRVIKDQVKRTLLIQVSEFALKAGSIDEAREHLLQLQHSYTQRVLTGVRSGQRHTDELMLEALAEAVTPGGIGGGLLSELLYAFDDDIEESKKRFVRVTFGSLTEGDLLSLSPVAKPVYKKISAHRAEALGASNVGNKTPVKPSDVVYVWREPRDGDDVVDPSGAIVEGKSELQQQILAATQTEGYVDSIREQGAELRGEPGQHEFRPGLHESFCIECGLQKGHMRHVTTN